MEREMKVLILGGDGYLGWPTAMYLASQGHSIHIIDSLIKKRWEAIAGAPPLFPVKSLRERVHIFETQKNLKIHVSILDIAENPKFLYEVFENFQPDAVIHYAEQPSAPYSMMTRESCVETQRNNIVGTLNLMFACMHIETPPHIIKLGTMGEYGTPNIDIEEGWLDVEHKGRRDRVLYPKKAGSFYHLSKVHDSHNLEFGCRVWGLRVSDLNQGIVYGTDTDETWLDKGLTTAFHYDAILGTVINRFLVQAACGKALTVYGSGEQKRGFIHIQDTLRCVELALLNPAAEGEFRVFNQLAETFMILHLAGMVSEVTGAGIVNLPNPRVEAESHYYNVKHTALEELGWTPIMLVDDDIERMYKQVLKYKKDIIKGVLYPEVKWRE